MGATAFARSFENLHKENHEEFYDSKKRLATYKKWPVRHQQPKELADEGFFFMNEADNVECAFCHMVLGDFEPTDKIRDLHEEISPNCPFVVNRNRAGGPLNGVDVVGFQEKSEKAERNLLKSVQFPKFKNIDVRVSTFENWPKLMPQRPETLAASGFFYTGTGDQCLCFFCGLGLRDWEKEDDPYVEHARWSPKCEYLLNKKGQGFVDKHREDRKEAVESKPEPAASEPVREENNGKNCNLCYNQDISTVFLPCGHARACFDCALQCETCPFCREPITEFRKIFLP